MSTPPPIGMSAPPPPPPPPPSPSRKGCFIAIGVVLILVLVGCLGVCLVGRRNPGGMTAWGMSMAHGGFMKSVASDVTPEQKAAFDAEFNAYQEWLKAATPQTFETQGQAVLGPFQYIQGAMRGDNSITSDEIQRFIEMSQQLRGVAPPPQAPAPVPAPVTPAETAPEGASAPIEGAPAGGGTPIEGTSPSAPTAPAPGTP